MLDRRVTMSRFAEPTEADEPKVVDVCSNCYEELVQGQEVYLADGEDRLCSDDCIHEYFYITKEVLF